MDEKVLQRSNQRTFNNEVSCVFSDIVVLYNDSSIPFVQTNFKGT